MIEFDLHTTRSRSAAITFPACDSPRVSVVIVTYTTGAIVERCLAALASTAAAIEVVVVDNSSDVAGGTHLMPIATRLRLVTSGVRVLASRRNLGFGGGNELGVAQSGADLLCLLNPDAIVQPGWFEPLVDAVGDRAIGIAAPVLLNADRSIQEAGQSLDGRAITRASRQLPQVDGVPVVDVDYSSAACWMMRRSVHERVGGFDAAYHPAYFEDVDFALRVRRAGYRTVLATGSSVVHETGSSTRSRPQPALANQATFRRRWAPYLRQLAPR